MALLVGPAVLLHLAFGAEVEGRGGDVEIPLLNHLGEVAEEERHNQRVDVRAIDVGIGHDNHLLVAQLVDIGCFAVFAIYTETDT